METTPKASPPMIVPLFLAHLPSTEWAALTAMETAIQIPIQCGLPRMAVMRSEKTQHNGQTLMKMALVITGATRHGMIAIHHGQENTARTLSLKMHALLKQVHRGKTE